ncbi:MAG: division/cell wall cluster transcriptional repressor MraZ [Halofilum sp. (in: g-proteobacteria)]|nr:division/cell wall cluster transcriptional repressor MraZ [Halofilum sp. (in: g-proteobacteria)]
MFRGVTNLSLDAKGRMAVPARYRERLQAESDGRVVVTVDRDGCLLIYPMREWEAIERELVQLPSLNRQARRLQRLLIGHATECEFDAQGRILVPGPLREFAGIDRRVVLIGQGNKFELWDEATLGTSSRRAWLAADDEEEGLELPAALESLSL